MNRYPGSAGIARASRRRRLVYAAGVASLLAFGSSHTVWGDTASPAVQEARLAAANGAPPGYSVSTTWLKQLLGQHVPATAVMLEHMTNRVTQTVSVPVKPLAVSDNWAGEVRQMGNTTYKVTFVHDSSNAVSYGSYPQLSSWTGIGGIDNGSALIQAGVVHQSPPVTAYEMLPGTPQTLFNVNDGDSVETAIQWDVSTQQWAIAVADDRTNQWWGNEFQYTSDQRTAEWITEDGDSNSSPVPDVCCFYHGGADYQETDLSSDEPFTTTTGMSSYYDVTLCAPAGGRLYPGSYSQETGNSFTVYQSSASC